MAIYFITGKLGAGKSLIAVFKIRDYLSRGRPVATNLNLNLNNLLSVKNKSAVVYRIPDKPKVEDLIAIGNGNRLYDESQNGLIVLDECATWFNSRSWADKTRQALIDYLVHIRKLGWDVYFLVQSYGVVDKQARELLGEHIVICKRLDRLPVPLLSSLTKLIGFNLMLPRAHLAIVRYGEGMQAPVVDRWLYRGSDLFSSYDTKQIFCDSPDVYTSQLIPPFFTHGRYIKPLTFGRFMRLTKIYFKRHSKTKLIVLGFLAGMLAFYVYSAFFITKPTVSQQTHGQQETQANIASTTPSKPIFDIYHYDFSNYKLLEYMVFNSDNFRQVYIKLYLPEFDIYLSYGDFVKNGYQLLSTDYNAVSFLSPSGKEFVFRYFHSASDDVSRSDLAPDAL